LRAGADGRPIDAAHIRLSKAPQDARLARDGLGFFLPSVGRVDCDLFALLFLGAGPGDKEGLERIADAGRLLAQPPRCGMGEYLVNARAKPPWARPCVPVRVDRGGEEDDTTTFRRAPPARPGGCPPAAPVLLQEIR